MKKVLMFGIVLLLFCFNLDCFSSADITNYTVSALTQEDGVCIAEIAETSTGRMVVVNILTNQPRFELAVPAKIIEEIKKHDGYLKINGSGCSVWFTADSLPQSRFVLAMGLIDVEKGLSLPQKRAMPNKEKFEFNIFTNGEWLEYLNYHVKISIPYEKLESENDDFIVASIIKPFYGLQGQTGYGYFGDRSNYKGESPISDLIQMPSLYDTNKSLVTFLTNRTGIYCASENTTAFTDITENHWAKNYVYYLSSNGVISGAEGEFQPQKEISRAEFVKMLVKSMSINKPGQQCWFSDVIPNNWHYSFVSAAFENKIIKGDFDSAMNPNDPITKQDLIVMIGRAIKVLPLEDYSGGYRFVDEYLISEYAKSYIAWALNEGIISMNETMLLEPDKNVSRAEATKIIALVLKNYLKTN